MLVGDKLSKGQFQDIMACVKQLLNQIELTKLATLPADAESFPGASAADLFGAVEESKQTATAVGGDELDFLSDQQ